MQNTAGPDPTPLYLEKMKGYFQTMQFLKKGLAEFAGDINLNAFSDWKTEQKQFKVGCAEKFIRAKFAKFATFISFRSYKKL